MLFCDASHIKYISKSKSCFNLIWDIQLNGAVKINDRRKKTICLNCMIEPFRFKGIKALGLIATQSIEGGTMTT